MSKQEQGIKWEKAYELGYKKVDEQHQKLFELLSELIVSCEEGNEAEKVKEALDFLVNYTVQHFSDEEELQAECGFPDRERHKVLHEKFKGAVGDLVKRYEESGSSAGLAKDMNRIVVLWLLNHIQVEDKKIGKHMGTID